jgi:hypothetical protein
MRLKRLSVSPFILMHMMSGTFRVVANALPDDATLRQTVIDPQTGNVVLFVESASFEQTHEGEIVPEFQAPMIERMP